MVQNEHGLHMRPLSIITQILKERCSDVTFTYNNQVANARNIIDLMILSVPKDSQVIVDIQGEDAKETAEVLMDAFNQKFWEE